MKNSLEALLAACMLFPQVAVMQLTMHDERIVPRQTAAISAESLEQSYERAVKDASYRPDFVRNLRNIVNFLSNVTNISYSVRSDIDGEDDIFMRTKCDTVFLGDKTAPADCGIVIYDAAFITPKKITSIYDFLSALGHEFRHAEINKNGSEPIIGYCITKQGTLDLELRKILSELEAYGKEINESLHFVDGKLTIYSQISKPYAMNILNAYSVWYKRLEQKSADKDLKDGVREDLLKKYYILHFKFRGPKINN